MPPEKIEVTADELNAMIEQRVEKEKLKILIDDFKTHKDDEEKRLMAIDRNITEIFELMRAFPDRVTRCRDDLEADIHAELERHYAAETTVQALRVELKNDIKLITSRFKWTVAVIVSAAGVLQFITTMFWFGYKISQLGVGQ